MTQKKSILFILPDLNGGGAQRVVTLLIKHIDKKKYRPLVLMMKREGELLSELPSEIPVFALHASKARHAYFKIMKEIRKLRPDIVYSFLGYINLVVILTRFFVHPKVRFVCRETNIPSLNNINYPFPLLVSFLYKAFYRFYHRIICQSKDMYADLLAYAWISKKNTVIINNPIDTELIRRKRFSGKKLFVNEHNIIAAGKLLPQKGFDLLLEAFSLINVKDCHLTILGKGAGEGRLKRLAEQMGIDQDVTFAGYCENPYKLMAQADLFVLSSRYEGFPNVVLEANACGIPVVAFECLGGVNEIIQEGVNGWKVERGDVPALAAKIQFAMDHPLDPKAIERYIHDKYNHRKIIPLYEKVFDSLTIQ